MKNMETSSNNEKLMKDVSLDQNRGKKKKYQQQKGCPRSNEESIDDEGSSRQLLQLWLTHLWKTLVFAVTSTTRIIIEDRTCDLWIIIRLALLKRNHFRPKSSSSPQAQTRNYSFLAMTNGSQILASPTAVEMANTTATAAVAISTMTILLIVMQI